MTHFSPYQAKSLQIFHHPLAGLLPPVLRLQQVFKHLLSVPMVHVPQSVLPGNPDGQFSLSDTNLNNIYFSSFDKSIWVQKQITQKPKPLKLLITKSGIADNLWHLANAQVSSHEQKGPSFQWPPFTYAMCL